MKDYLVDTCVWIEWVTGGPLQSQFAAYLKDEEHVIVPALVQAELFKWLLREKTEALAFSIIGVTAQCQVIVLDTAIALLAAELGLKHKLALADSIIYATAQHCQATLLTCDEHFKGLENVIYFPK